MYAALFVIDEIIINMCVYELSATITASLGYTVNFVIQNIK